MAIAVSPLAMREETLRHKEVQFVAGARHCDVKKPTLLLDFGCCAGGEIGGDTPSTTFSTNTERHSCPLVH